MKMLEEEPLEEEEETIEEKEEPPEVIEAKKLDRKLNRVLNLIKRTFTPIQFKEDMKEKELEVQLVQLLTAGFQSYKTEYQVRTRAGIVDIVIDDKFAIELKLATIPNLQRLIGQAIMYIKDYPRVGVVVLDQGKMKKGVLKEYLEVLNGISNVKAISVIPSK